MVKKPKPAKTRGVNAGMEFRKVIIFMAYLTGALRMKTNVTGEIFSSLQEIIPVASDYGIDPPMNDTMLIIENINKGNFDVFSLVKEMYKNFFTPLKKAIENDPSVQADDMSLFNSFSTLFAARSVDRWDSIETTIINKLEKFGMPAELRKLWRVKADETSINQDSEKKQLLKIVEKVREKTKTKPRSPRDEFLLSTNEQNWLRENLPELNKTYNSLKNSALKKARIALRDFVLNNNGLVQVSIARNHLESLNLIINDLPEELDRLFVGSDSFFYTAEGRKIVNRPAAGAIIGDFNPQYDPKKDDQWIFQYRTETGEWTYAYTEDFKKESKVEKFDKVEQNIEKVFEQRSLWLNDMKNNRAGKNQILGLICDLLFHFAARIGGVGNQTDGQTTYGISTLKVEHYEKKGNDRIIEYAGKSGQIQKHVINASDPQERLYIPILDRLVKGKDEDEYIFTYDDKHITADQVRAYVRSKGIEVTPHYFRSIRGTKMIMDIMEKVDKKEIASMTSQQAEKFFMEKALNVGKLLGHFNKGNATAATAISNYIMPSYMSRWFSEHNFRVPLWAADNRQND